MYVYVHIQYIRTYTIHMEICSMVCVHMHTYVHNLYKICTIACVLSAHTGHTHFRVDADTHRPPLSRVAVSLT